MCISYTNSEYFFLFRWERNDNSSILCLLVFFILTSFFFKLPFMIITDWLFSFIFLSLSLKYVCFNSNIKRHKTAIKYRELLTNLPLLFVCICQVKNVVLFPSVILVSSLDFQEELLNKRTFVPSLCVWVGIPSLFFHPQGRFW